MMFIVIIAALVVVLNSQGSLFTHKCLPQATREVEQLLNPQVDNKSIS